MANNMSSVRRAMPPGMLSPGSARTLFWCSKYTVILPLATMALMALFVLWKDNTTPGKFHEAQQYVTEQVLH